MIRETAAAGGKEQFPAVAAPPLRTQFGKIQTFFLKLQIEEFAVLNDFSGDFPLRNTASVLGIPLVQAGSLAPVHGSQVAWSLHLRQFRQRRDYRFHTGPGRVETFHRSDFFFHVFFRNRVFGRHTEADREGPFFEIGGPVVFVTLQDIRRVPGHLLSFRQLLLQFLPETIDTGIHDDPFHPDIQTVKGTFRTEFFGLIQQTVGGFEESQIQIGAVGNRHGADFSVLGGNLLDPFLHIIQIFGHFIRGGSVITFHESPDQRSGILIRIHQQLSAQPHGQRQETGFGLDGTAFAEKFFHSAVMEQFQIGRQTMNERVRERIFVFDILAPVIPDLHVFGDFGPLEDDLSGLAVDRTVHRPVKIGIGRFFAPFRIQLGDADQRIVARTDPFRGNQVVFIREKADQDVRIFVLDAVGDGVDEIDHQGAVRALFLGKRFAGRTLAVPGRVVGRYIEDPAGDETLVFQRFGLFPAGEDIFFHQFDHQFPDFRIGETDLSRTAGRSRRRPLPVQVHRMIFRMIGGKLSGIEIERMAGSAFHKTESCTDGSGVHVPDAQQLDLLVFPVTGVKHPELKGRLALDRKVFQGQGRTVRHDFGQFIQPVTAEMFFQQGIDRIKSAALASAGQDQIFPAGADDPCFLVQRIRFDARACGEIGRAHVDRVFAFGVSFGYDRERRARDFLQIQAQILRGMFFRRSGFLRFGDYVIGFALFCQDQFGGLSCPAQNQCSGQCQTDPDPAILFRDDHFLFSSC